MSLNRKLGLILFLLTIMLVSTPFFGRVETRRFSAYAACRKVAMATKGYAVWQHEKTIERMVLSRIIFSDGFNNLDCRALGLGPFWMVRKSLLSWNICDKDAGNGKMIMCSEEYFGVSP
jgi:hypothetical protein